VHELIQILDAQSLDQLQHSFNQMHPAHFDTIAYAEGNVAERIRQIFTDHFFEQGVIACPEKQLWRVWVAPFTQEARQSGEGERYGYHQKSTGVSVAVDYRKKSHWLFSAGLSYATSHLCMPEVNIKAEFKSYAGTLGAAWTNAVWFADFQFSYLHSPIQARRTMHFEAKEFPQLGAVRSTAAHDTSSNQILGHLGIGYDFKVAAGTKALINITPFANVDYVYDMQSGYWEEGADIFNLEVDEKSYDLLRPEAGFGIGYHRCFRKIDLTLDLSASYVLEFRLIGNATEASFRQSPCRFSVHGLNPENNLICPAARFRLAIPKLGMSLTLGYHGEFGEDFVGNAVEVELRQGF
jgi:outer membrane autotransporter protein